MLRSVNVCPRNRVGTRVNADGVAAARGEAGEAALAAAAGDRADAVGRDTERLMRLLYEVVLSEDQGNFGFGQTELPDEAKGEIDRLANQLKADAPGNVYIEIEGHTDATGEANVNERLGLERAEAVKRYLHESHQIPLHRMNTISYGEDSPVAPNDTREGPSAEPARGCPCVVVAHWSRWAGLPWGPLPCVAVPSSVSPLAGGAAG